jgi:hypothetical protein
MATLTATIRSIFEGTATPVGTNADMQSAFGTLIDFLTGTLGSDSTTKSAARNLLEVPARAGVRNVIINGDFRVNQRGYAGGATAGANEYTFDRWRVITTGQALSWTNDGNGRLVTVPAGGLEQLVWANEMMVTSWGINWEGSANCTVNGTAATKGQILTLPLATQVSIKFFSGTLTRVRLEPDRAQPWEPRPLSVETALCQLYYEQTDAVITLYSGATSSTATIRLRGPKRVPPTFTISTATGVSTTPVSAASGAEQLTITMTTTGNVSFKYAADSELT